MHDRRFTTPRKQLLLALIVFVLSAHNSVLAETSTHETNPAADALSPDVWRNEHRIIDLHMHIEGKPERFERA